MAGVEAQVFEDVTAAAGFFGLNSSWCSAWGDMDNDGDLDAITLGHLQESTNSISQIWRNNGDETFSDVTFEAGYLQQNGDVHGVVWGDFDNDGDQDFYVAKGSKKDKVDQENQYHDLMQNNGDGTFTNIATEAGVTGLNHRGRAAYAVDSDIDGDLEIFFTAFDRGPKDFGNSLFRNDGNMSFVDIARGAGIAEDDDQNRTASWADYNNDGYPDLLLMYPCTLFANQGNGTFLDTTAIAGISPSFDCSASAWADYDNDGFLDVYITTGSNVEYEQTTPGFLYRNNGNGTFSDVAATSGTGVSEIENPCSFCGERGVTWGDFDNDGLVDLYIVSNSNGPNRLLRNNGDGTFSDVTENAGAGGEVGTGMAIDATFVDYNNDGALDLFTTNGRSSFVGEYLLLRNPGNDNNWVKVELIGRVSNRDGHMTRARLTTSASTQLQVKDGPAHYMCQDNAPLHFGVGQADAIQRLDLTWPNGVTQQLENLAVKQTVTVEEGRSISQGQPRSEGLGYYIWVDPDGWRISWTGETDGTHAFSGRITTDGSFSSVIPERMENSDTVTWGEDVIEFSAFARGGDDLIRFAIKGDTVSFDLEQDGAARPEFIRIGAHNLAPATLPLTLRGGSFPPEFTQDPFSQTGARVGVTYNQGIGGRATDPEGDALVFSKVSGPAWLDVRSSGFISGTPSAGDVGRNQWTVKVEDGNGGGDAATLIIDVVGNPPAFTEDPFTQTDARVGVLYNEGIGGKATDPDGDALVFSKVSGPAWLEVRPSGSIRGTPGAGDVGMNQWTVMVEDGTGGSDQARMMIKVGR